MRESVVKRVTARYFQSRFQRLHQPTLVNKGIFFPQVTKELLMIAEDTIKATNQGREE
jgi:hypothetical protein